MSNTIKIMCFLMLSTAIFGQKKFETFEVTRQIEAPIEKVWAIVAEDFANVSKRHHGFVSSKFTDGYTSAEEGSVRINFLDEEKSRFVKEKLINYDHANYSFTVEVIDGKGLPLATGTNVAYYKLTEIDQGICSLSIHVKMRPKPAIVGKIFKGQYQKWMDDYAIGLKHYAQTGETVNSTNFENIEKIYQ